MTVVSSLDLAARPLVGSVYTLAAMLCIAARVRMKIED